VRRLGVLLLCALALPAASARAWTWPVDGQVLRGFNFDHDHPYAAGQHRGIDISAPVGATVLAPAEGVVSFAGTVPSSGKTVSIQTPFGTTVTLLHLGSIAARRGGLVNEGSVVGSVGASDDPKVPEPHVSLGLRTTSDPQGYLDPLTFLPARVSPVPSAAETPAPVEAVAPTDVPAEDPPAAESPGTATPPEPAVPPAADSTPAVTPSEQTVPSQPAEPAVKTPAVAEQPSPVSVAPTASVAGTEAATDESVQSVDPGVLSAEPLRDADGAAGEQPLLPAVVLAAGAVDGNVVEPAIGDPFGATAIAATMHLATGAELRQPVAHGGAFPDNARTGAPTDTSAASGDGLGTGFPVWATALAAALLAVGAAAWRKRAGPEAVRMMDLPERESLLARNEAEECSRRAGLAVRGGPAAPRSRGGLRGARGHLRALPPPEGEQGLDGQWDGRARHARDGDGGQGWRLAA
jgi:peptidase M23-like protein